MSAATVLIVIPARIGSKGIPQKNLRLFRGKPLVEWSLITAMEERERSGAVVVVSTDSDEIADIGLQYKAAIVMRTRWLSDEFALTDPVLLDVLDHGFTRDVTVLLQPTSPVRPAGIIGTCVRATLDYDADSAWTVHLGHFTWQKVCQPNGAFTLKTNSPRRPRRQGLSLAEKVWIENGNCYAVRTDTLLNTGSRIGAAGKLVEIPRLYGIEIDSLDDWALAEAAFDRARATISPQPMEALT